MGIFKKMDRKPRARFILEFDEVPEFIFVQHADWRRRDVYQHGKKLEGLRAVAVRAEVGDVTSYELEFIAGMTK